MAFLDFFLGKPPTPRQRKPDTRPASTWRPAGRPNTSTPEMAGNAYGIELNELYTSNGYDFGGVYWGEFVIDNKSVWRAEFFLDGGSKEEFLRAADEAEARALLLARYPGSAISMPLYTLQELAAATPDAPIYFQSGRVWSPTRAVLWCNDRPHALRCAPKPLTMRKFALPVETKDEDGKPVTLTYYSRDETSELWDIATDWFFM